jgi:hypothetical protein
LSAFDVLPALVNPPFVARSSELQRDTLTGRVSVRESAGPCIKRLPPQRPGRNQLTVQSGARLAQRVSIAPNDDSVYWHVTCLRKVFCVSLDVLV